MSDIWEVGIQSGYGIYRDAECWIKSFVEEGDVVFAHQVLGVLMGDSSKIESIISPSDGYVRESFFKDKERIFHIQDERNEAERNRRSEYTVFVIDKISIGVAKGIIDQNNPSDFTHRICSDLDGLAKREENGIRIGGREYGRDAMWINLSKDQFEIVRWIEEIDTSGRYVKCGQPIVEVMRREHADRFQAALDKAREEVRLKDEFANLAERKDGLQSEVDAILDDAERKSAELIEAANETLREADKARHEAELKGAEIVRLAKDKQEIAQAAEAAANEAAAKIIADAKTEAGRIAAQVDADTESRKASILESARTKRQEATALREAAAADAIETAQRAELDAQETRAAAESDARATRQAIEDSAAKLNLDAVVGQLYELQAKGQLPGLMERSALRRLYLALGELLADAQGFSAPETLAQMENQNRMDEIKAMNYALAKEIRDAEQDESLPDVVRERMVEQLLDMTEAKGGSIVKKAVDDG